VYRPRRPDSTDAVVDHIRRTLSFCSSTARPPPDFCSVTTRAGSWSASAEIAARTQDELGLRSVLHVCWSGESPAGRAAVLDRISSLELWGVLALRGDAPDASSDIGGIVTGEDAASGVAAYFSGSPSPPRRVFVAAHPGWWPRHSPHGEQHTVADEARWVARKVAAASTASATEGTCSVSVITQVCFDSARVVAFVVALRSLGCTAPVHAGVMVARDAAALRRVASMAGIEPPGDLVDFADQTGARMAGAEAAKVWRLAEASGSPLAGIHFFGMNDTELLCESVRVMDAAVDFLVPQTWSTTDPRVLAATRRRRCRA
jgi:5,10-methylenetetrahydrofolate reductase